MKVASRKSVLSLKLTDAAKRRVVLLAAHMTQKTGERWTLTRVMEEAIDGLAKREKVR